MLQTICKSAAIGLLFISSLAFSGVEIGGTRLIYNGNASQTAISVNNPDDKPYLIQSWVTKDQNGEDTDSIFTTTPPLFKLTPHTQNSVRVMLTGNSLPTDRESVYWLTIKAIPSSSPDASNELLIAVKSKMKVFYRPAGLSGDPATAYQQLTVSKEADKLRIHNPSPYNVSIYEFKVNGEKKERPSMIPPFQSVLLPQSVVASGEVSWRAINDFGGVTAEHKIKM